MDLTVPTDATEEMSDIPLDNDPSRLNDETSYPWDSVVNIGGRSAKSKEKIQNIQRYDRLHLLEALRRAFVKREDLQRQNVEIQTKLARHFKKKKSEVAKHESNARDQELRYLKDLDLLEDMRSSQNHKRQMFEDTIRRMKERCREKIKIVDEERQVFIKYKMAMAKSAISRRTGAHISDKVALFIQMTLTLMGLLVYATSEDEKNMKLFRKQETYYRLCLNHAYDRDLQELEVYVTSEDKKNTELFQVRLEYIRRKNKLHQQEQQLKLKENLGEGLSMIDFEQLKIENQTYNEKIEERNEELLKLRKKITSTVQVLTHLKEKLQWLQRENQIHAEVLDDTDKRASQKRDIMGRTKKVRDLLRRENVKLRVQGGLRGRKVLLKDYEEQRDTLDGILVRIEQQRMRHSDLSLNIARLRRKIAHARISKSDDDPMPLRVS